MRILTLNLIPYLVLENLIPPSLNTWLSGTSWRVKARQKTVWEILVKDEVRKQKLEPIPIRKGHPVTLVVTVEFGDGKRRFDASNLAIAPKFIEDALKKCGMIQNDSGIYIRRSMTEPVRSVDGKNRTIVEYSEESS